MIGSVISGKIKELKEWHEIKQTELTRCKIEYVKKEPEKWNDEAQRALDAAFAVLA